MSAPRAPVRRARIDARKIVHYLLDPDHPQGGPKARFLAQFGFDRTAPEVLVRALLRHFEEGEVARVVDSAWGPRLHVEGPMSTPNGDRPIMRTVWQAAADGAEAAFVTAKPLREPLRKKA